LQHFIVPVEKNVPSSECDFQFRRQFYDWKEVLHRYTQTWYLPRNTLDKLSCVAFVYSQSSAVMFAVMSLSLSLRDP